MSIEQNLAALTAAVIELTNAVRGQSSAPAAPVAPTPAPAPIVQAPVTHQAQMPPPPMFAAPAPAPVAQSAPFGDAASLIAYVMAAYKEMGPTKGAQIQGVLGAIGVQNINDVRPEQYGSLFAGVEALKRG